MANIRLIARLDVKPPNLIKGVHLEGLRVMGNPQEFATRYYHDGIDELIYIDTVASLYGRDNLIEIIRHTAAHIFIPITAGGGIRSVDDAKALLRAGADKVAVNTAAVTRPALITEISRTLGNQCMVLSIQAKKRRNADGWVAYTDNAREPTERDVVAWAKEGEALGAGEILLTSVDREGTRKGFDLDLLRAVSTAVTIPVIASGGLGKPEDFVAAVTEGKADAVAVADALHYGRHEAHAIRQAALDAGLHVRRA
ncbi:MAG: imidazole glycerol phosphate synthase subunit HisF [Nitrospinae bacterium]|nr:imidazole glycerol phosphate synthase subunit HisF [Nitrospinota bacterium]